MSQLSVPGTSNLNSAVSPNEECVIGTASAPFELPHHIPVPRPAVLQEMGALASSIGNAIDLASPASTADTVGYLVPDFALLVLGTACWRPLLCEEAQEIGQEHQLNVAIVRGDDRDFLGNIVSTLDILLMGSQTWLSRLRPWRRTAADDLWFAPVQGEGRAIRLSAGLLALSPRAPFSSLFEREYGFEVAQTVARDRSDKWVGGRSHG